MLLSRDSFYFNDNLALWTVYLAIAIVFLAH
jgi:hypothetical protein